jgi:hypothetical protein
VTPAQVKVIRDESRENRLEKPASRGKTVKKFCQCLGLSALLLVGNYGDLLGGGADVRMHVPYRLTSICVAEIADIVLLGLILFAMLEGLRRTRYYPWIRLMFVILMPPYLAERTQSLWTPAMREIAVTMVAISWAAAVLLLLLAFPRAYRRLLRVGDAVGVFLALFAFCNIMQLLYVMTWKPGPQQVYAAWDKASQPIRQHPRTVWIVFDELSYDQTFEHRAHDLALPNFDALRQQSTLYTQIQPVGLRTVKVIPSLFTGAVVDDYRFGFDDSLRVHYEGVRGWHLLEGAATIFGEAKRAGWRTAAVGWYNPYCGLYRGALDSCYWTNLDRLDGDVSQRSSLWRNVWRPMGQIGRELKSPLLSGHYTCTFDVRRRYETYVALRQHAVNELENDQADFVYLHFSVPHSPNIWSRSEEAFTRECGSSYLDNLALADKQLGELMALLKSSARWKDTTVIVQGDHSWRTMVWDGTPAWTDEDDDAGRRGFDSRPALLIHAAGQEEPKTDERAMPLTYVHKALESVLQARTLP